MSIGLKSLSLFVLWITFTDGFNLGLMQAEKARLQVMRLGRNGVKPSTKYAMDANEKKSLNDRPVQSLKMSSSNEEVKNVNNDKSMISNLNEVGLSFKARAQNAEASFVASEKASQKIRYALQSSLYYFLFILYRAYRGFFILLPAVFRKSYATLKTAMASELSIEDDTADQTGETETVSRRTKVTITVMAIVVTSSYVLGGILRVAEKFFRTVTKTSSIPKSFEAAADELALHQELVSRGVKFENKTDINLGENGSDLSP